MGFAISEDVGGGEWVGVLDGLVRHHVQALYDHIWVVYPSADPAVVLASVFAEVGKMLDAGSVPGDRLWLFGVTRRIVLAGKDEQSGWRRGNAAAVVASIRRAGARWDEWHAWSDTERVVAAVQRLATRDQEILRLITAVDGVDAAGMAIVLDVDVETAATDLDRVTSEFVTAYEHTDLPGQAITGGTS